MTIPLLEHSRRHSRSTLISEALRHIMKDEAPHAQLAVNDALAALRRHADAPQRRRMCWRACILTKIPYVGRCHDWMT